jgi:hypothetical protein
MEFRFQPRDGEILWDIYTNDGVLSQKQVRQKHFPDKTKRAVQRRMSKLFHNGFVKRGVYRSPEPPYKTLVVYWLDMHGILYIAGQDGVEVPVPKNNSENQMRILAKKLREKKIRWLRKPRWWQIPHDLRIIDVRWAVEEACAGEPPPTFDDWVT